MERTTSSIVVVPSSAAVMPASNMVTMPAATAARSISEPSARVKISRSMVASGCMNSAIACRPR